MHLLSRRLPTGVVNFNLAKSAHLPTARLPSMAKREMSTVVVSPPTCRVSSGVGLDRNALQKTVQVLAARVPASRTGSILKAEPLRGTVINLRKVRTVVSDPSIGGEGQNLVLFRVASKDELPPTAKDYLEQKEGATFVQHELNFDYDYWSADEILQAVLPSDLCDGAPTGFAMTGHIAHLNLRDEYLPFKQLIGQIVLDKNPSVKTVVNKLETINNQFRVFDMELLAGEPRYVVEHHESGCRFSFDFREVYWNSRLHTEHDRLVQLLKPEDGIVADVFAGVGPFALPAAKKGCAVLANDLNPNSVKWLRTNVEDNHVSENVRVFCEDGRGFIRSAFRIASEHPFAPYSGPKAKKKRGKANERLEPQSAADRRAEFPERGKVTHFIMNLPETAIGFLDAFRGVLTRELSGTYERMPMVHCYCFTRFLDLGDAEADIRKRVEEAMGHGLEEDVSLHLVRSVAPKKEMYCVSFRLPRGVAIAG